MKRFVLLGVALLLVASAASAGFDDDFYDHTLRIDYYHVGHSEMEAVSIDRMYLYGEWGGSRVNLVDNLDYGAYYHKIYDADSGTLIYSRGFDSYYKEYVVSTPGLNGQTKTFHETAIVPAPRRKVIFALDRRLKDGKLVEVFRTEVDPEDVMIVRFEAVDPDVIVIPSLQNGISHMKADVAIVAEGYTAEEEDKFRADLERFTKVLFKEEPLKSHKSAFNIWGIFKPSVQSGIDEPTHNVYRRTAVGATFNSMGSERYILTEENRNLRDIARHAPYDALYIMINHHRYGGGGIYNFYCTFTTDNQWSEYVFVHEFGHSFFGLADEYYTSSTAYEDFYSAGFEPSEANITAATDAANVKWKAFMEDGIEVPTPWEKEGYDKIAHEWSRVRGELNGRVAELRRTGAPEASVKAAEETFAKTDREYAERMYEYLKKSKYAGKVGVYQGAGYLSEGMYRSQLDCIMFNKVPRYFCAACKMGIADIIEWYSR